MINYILFILSVIIYKRMNFDENLYFYENLYLFEIIRINLSILVSIVIMIYYKLKNKYLK
jgi:hypothetical protein